MGKVNGSVRIGLVVVTTLVLAACGGSTGGASQEPGGSTAPSAAAPSEGTASQAPASQEPVVTPGSSTGGGPAGGVCDLVTAGELESILGLGSVATIVLAGPPDTCDVQVDNAPVAAFVWTTTGGRMIYDILAAGADAEPVGGIGDGAFFSAEQRLLFVLKGDATLSVAVFADSLDEDAQFEAMKKIAAAAVSRM